MKSLLVVCLVFLCACQPRANIEHVQVNGRPAQFILPKMPAKGIVFYHHGMGETENPLAEKRKNKFIRSIVADGFIVASTEAHGDNWSNNESTNDYAALYREADARWPLVKTWINFGQSMGGPTAINTLRYSPKLKGLLLIYAVGNISAIHAGGKFSKSIDDAYLGAKWNDPADLAASHYLGVRIRAHASYADTVVPRASNTDLIIAKAKPTAIEAQVIDCQGEHGHESHFDPLIADTLRFLKPMRETLTILILCTCAASAVWNVEFRQRDIP